MSDHLAAAAAAVGGPEHLVMRSAEARAKADGTTADAVLARWAGVEAAEPVSAQAALTPPAAPEPTEVSATAAVPEQTTRVPDGTPAEAGEPEEPEPGEPEEPESEEPDRWESEEEAAAAGAIPRWLAALFVVIPVIAVLYVLFLPNGPNCGDAGRLAVDPVSGEAVNCDFTPYGSEVVDYYSMGLDRYELRCASCHGEIGGGAGNFPAFVGGALLEAFPEGRCESQVEWVAVGSAGWPDAVYGDTGKPVGGSGAVMPAFGTVLDDEELRAVVLYERVRFGGQPLESALTDCGLAETEADE